MPDLATFQAHFAAAVLASEPIDDVSRHSAFAVYRNTSARGAVEALRAAFPTVDMLIGDDMFTQVALDYRDDHPPPGPILSRYGAGFADFLAAQPWTGELPYLADVARLDRLWLDTFLAPDAAPAQAPACIDPGHLIALHPATRFAWLSTPAMTIWQAHRHPAGVADLALEWRDEGALFTRREQDVHATAVRREFHSLLLACRSPISAQACFETITTAFPEADAIDVLRRGFQSGALITL